MGQFWQLKATDSSSFIYDQVSDRKYVYADLKLAVDEKVKEFNAISLSSFSNEKCSLCTPLLIAIKARNNYASLVNYLAILNSVHIGILIDASLSATKLNKLQAQYKINVLVADDEYSILSSEPINLHPKIKLLLSTSGSTGSAKLVKLSKENLMANAASICQFLPITDKDTIVTSLPCHYSFGLSIINTHLAKRANLLLTDENVMSSAFWQLFKQFEPSAFYGVPFSYEMLKMLRVERLPLSSIKYFAQAGGRLNENLLNYFYHYSQNQQQRFYVMYGQTEATARIAYLAPEKLSMKQGYIGQAIPNGHLWLENEDAEKITTANTTGELCYQGDNVFLGLAESVQSLTFIEDIPYLKTGDMAIFDDDGDYKIVGRIKRFIKIVGKRINLDEVQESIEKQFGNAVIIGTDDNLFCLYTDNYIETKEVVRFLAKFLLINKKYIQCQFIDEIPHLASGKIDYQVLNKKIGL